jgi:hypothetical protein
MDVIASSFVPGKIQNLIRGGGDDDDYGDDDDIGEDKILHSNSLFL